MKARNKVAMKRGNGTHVYDIYVKKPGNCRHAGGIRAASRYTGSARTRTEETGWKTVRSETGWKTALHKPDSTSSTPRGKKTETAGQPFVRLGDDLV